MEIVGKNGIAKVYTDLIEEKAIQQIQEMMDEDITKDTQVRIMPDVHAGKGSTVGTTIMMEKVERISPNVIGVDIGCGITAIKIDAEEVDLELLDKVINENIPSGFNVREEPKSIFNYEMLNIPNLDKDYLNRSLGTLGGGNHYIELAIDEEGYYWISVHSGSRNLGVKVADYYQDIADKSFQTTDFSEIIEKLKSEGKEQEIETTIKKIKTEEKENMPNIPYLQGVDLLKYIVDMGYCMHWANWNRNVMLKTIMDIMGWKEIDYINSVHNYIDFDRGIIRKGATSAMKNELAVIPINMKDGTLIVKGKGNPDWNYSAPHGAGRLMSRRKAKENIDIETYRKQMDGIYTTSVNENTLDEAPEAYKPIDNLIENIKDTVEIVTTLKPVYNFKAH